MAGIEDTLKLRAIGRGSLSSVLKVLVDIFWITACAALGFIWIITFLSIIATLSGGIVENSILGRISLHADPFRMTSLALVGSILCIGVMSIASNLRSVFETLVDGDPFVPENAIRFRKIALIIAILELTRILVNPVIAFIINIVGMDTQLQPVGILTRLMSTNFITWGAVLILVVLSQVFAEGARLREDQQMTI
ncbi:DUF2975 domain-containing protein [Hirschia baltica]|uniref:DUF2975 domain-containing protein n=1 Tax=Hirschia baltica (strain ATCC 49814 / DSM 5838 / IFAM 1418) TaxID=582402 RepID=C6XIH2_HIRBI|nr:DUF2975 domain-containing protein [Hirschia baltica]ACT60779.1 conserved hypothetical protein [Hirschia baltica ATCC 49814]